MNLSNGPSVHLVLSIAPRRSASAQLSLLAPFLLGQLSYPQQPGGQKYEQKDPCMSTVLSLWAQNKATCLRHPAVCPLLCPVPCSKVRVPIFDPPGEASLAGLDMLIGLTCPGLFVVICGGIYMQILSTCRVNYRVPPSPSHSFLLGLPACLGCLPSALVLFLSVASAALSPLRTSRPGHSSPTALSPVAETWACVVRHSNLGTPRKLLATGTPSFRLGP